MIKEQYKLKSLLGSIFGNAECNLICNEEDYVNPDDGLLYCGKCNTPRQHLVEFQDIETSGYKIPILCQCREKEYQEEQIQKQKQRDMAVIEELRKRSNMDLKFFNHNFEAFQATKENERLLKISRRYVDNFDEMIKRNQGLLFWGDVGTGKTFTAACIANALLNNKTPIVMTSFVKLLETTQYFKEDEEKLLNNLNRAKLLIIDDLGAERGTDFALEKVYNIIDSRYRARLPMILTTNISLEEMKNASDIRYSRIYDRIFEVCYPVKFTGASFRKVEANRRYREMKNFLEGD